MNSPIDVVLEYLEPFEELFNDNPLEYEPSDSDYDSEIDRIHGVHVKSIKPINDHDKITTISRDDTTIVMNEKINENGKRIRSEENRSNQNTNSDIKRMKTDISNEGAIITRGDLFIPKHVFRVMVQDVVSEVCTTSDVNRFTPLSILILQHAAERCMEKRFEQANHFAEYYGRNAITQLDLFSAKSLLQHYTVPYKKPVFTGTD